MTARQYLGAAMILAPFVAAALLMDEQTGTDFSIGVLSAVGLLAIFVAGFWLVDNG